MAVKKLQLLSISWIASVTVHGIMLTLGTDMVSHPRDFNFGAATGTSDGGEET